MVGPRREGGGIGGKMLRYLNMCLWFDVTFLSTYSRVLSLFGHWGICWSPPFFFLRAPTLLGTYHLIERLLSLFSVAYF
jgi:hypothetical protein